MARLSASAIERERLRCGCGVGESPRCSDIGAREMDESWSWLL